jgi:hypothetical protein
MRLDPGREPAGSYTVADSVLWEAASGGRRAEPQRYEPASIDMDSYD